MRKLSALIICFMLIGTGSAFAEPLQKHTFEVGPEISRIVYEEPNIMKQEGVMYGINASYAYHSGLMLKAEGKYSFGRVDYSSPISGEMDDIDDYMLEFRGLVGYDFTISKEFILTPYIGIGYRYLNDDMSGMITDIGKKGYKRESNYIYSPIGVTAITSLGNGWSFKATAEYDIFWWGKQISHLSDVAPGRNDPENRQRKGYGMRGSMKFQKKVKEVSLAIEPFIRYWHIMKSKEADVTYYGIPVGTAWEPRNHSLEFGLMLSLIL